MKILKYHTKVMYYYLAIACDFSWNLTYFCEKLYCQTSHSMDDTLWGLPVRQAALCPEMQSHFPLQSEYVELKTGYLTQQSLTIGRNTASQDGCDVGWVSSGPFHMPYLIRCLQQPSEVWVLLSTYREVKWIILKNHLGMVGPSWVLNFVQHLPQSKQVV